MWHYYKSTDQEDEDGEGDENSLMEVTLDPGDHKEEADENDEMVVISRKTHQVSLDFNVLLEKLLNNYWEVLEGNDWGCNGTISQYHSDRMNGFSVQLLGFSWATVQYVLQHLSVHAFCASLT